MEVRPDIDTVSVVARVWWIGAEVIGHTRRVVMRALAAEVS